MKCPSCGSERERQACSCGAKSSGYRKNGDIGFQISLGKRRVKPRFVYAGGDLKRVRD